MERNQSNNHTPESIKAAAVSRFLEVAPEKYDRGQQEHKGLIINRNLLDEIEAETIDLFFYVQALRIKLGAINEQKTNQSEGGQL